MYCTVALALMVDVSSSVSAENLMLQRKGYEEAFREPRIAQMIEDHAPVAVSFIEWADTQNVILGWTVLESSQDAAQFADRLSTAVIPHSGIQTALGDALNFGLEHFNSVPCEALRKVIDMSSDGGSNSGSSVEDARDKAESLRVTINGLPIVAGEAGLETYYHKYVVTSRGFVVPTESFSDLATAIRRKLQREIAAIGE